MEDLAAAGQAKRVLFDESQEGFHTHERRQLKDLLRRLSCLYVQLGLLSATVPYKFQHLLLKNFGLKQDQTLVIRAVTARPEICYHVVALPRSHPSTFFAEDAAIDMAQILKHHMRVEERMIIFVQTVAKADDIASGLKCAKYHSALPTDGENKMFNMQQWLSGESKIIVATPALIQGVDYPAVRFTIFVEDAYGAMSFVQGSGRGGRDGNRSDSFLVVDNRITYLDPRGRDVEGRSVLDSFKAAGHCRSGELSDFFDGRRVTCQDIDGQIPCDTCNPNDVFQGVAMRAAIDGYPNARNFYLSMAEHIYSDPRDRVHRLPPPRGSSLPIIPPSEDTAPPLRPVVASATASLKRPLPDEFDDMLSSSEWSADALKELDDVEKAATSKRPRTSNGQNA